LALAEWLQACRAKQGNPLGSETTESKDLIQSLTFKMIDRFDPSIAAILKTNEQLVALLSRH
jgi:hypothetical protein